MPSGQGLGVVDLGMNRHLPPMNLVRRGQKQLGGVPRRPPEHLITGVVAFVPGAFVSHPPERVGCVPAGHWTVVGCEARVHLPSL
jgi:hypothetical protein